MFFGTFPGGSGPTRCSEASVETNIPPAKDDAKLTALGISNTLELSSLEMGLAQQTWRASLSPQKRVGAFCGS